MKLDHIFIITTFYDLDSCDERKISKNKQAEMISPFTAHLVLLLADLEMSLRGLARALTGSFKRKITRRLFSHLAK